MTIDFTNFKRLDLHQDYCGADMRADKWGDYVSFDDLMKFLLDLGFEVKSVETENDADYWKRFWTKVEEIRASSKK